MAPLTAELEKMAEDHHPFTIAVERNIDIVDRFRWSIHKYGTLREKSRRFHATKQEALADAQKAMQMLVTRLRASR